MQPDIGRISRYFVAIVSITIIIIATVWFSHPLWLRHSTRSSFSVPIRAVNHNLPHVPASQHKPGSPIVNLAAFKNDGYLAFIWQNLLYEIDGSTSEVKQLTSSGDATRPLWSHDGKWLAYVKITTPNSEFGSLCLLRRDGTPMNLPKDTPKSVMYESLSWSPASDVLALRDLDGRLWLVPVDGKAQSLARVGSFAWSPDGSHLAYSVTPASSNPVNASDVVYIVSIDGGKPVQELIAPTKGQISIAAWWPDENGLLYWLASYHGVSVMADGLNLCSLRLGDRTPKQLAICQVNPNWLSFSS